MKRSTKRQIRKVGTRRNIGTAAGALAALGMIALVRRKLWYRHNAGRPMPDGLDELELLEPPPSARLSEEHHGAAPPYADISTMPTHPYPGLSHTSPERPHGWVP